MPLVVGTAEPVGIGDVKVRLNKSLAVDDAEIQAMLDAAVRAYRRVIGAPLTGSRTERHRPDSQGRVFLRARNVAAVTSVVDSAGAAVTFDAYDEGEEGILRGFTTTDEVTVTYTLGVAADHREAIIADVAGYFAATQRGTGGPGPGPAGGFFADGGEGRTPLDLFPRISALGSVAIA